ncbi:hypothetical protein QFC21_004547 [Naganishia friedmannii]|uniref:Uncharacterized protein n=1 Tax=Naganishia friedmannii TaxID=89922 RepID=A0ACC2VGE8_9TREE|nr:hypothetical protein QFC21_004547 [Naganishia friedmannii]
MTHLVKVDVKDRTQYRPPVLLLSRMQSALLSATVTASSDVETVMHLHPVFTSPLITPKRQSTS